MKATKRTGAQKKSQPKKVTPKKALTKSNSTKPIKAKAKVATKVVVPKKVLAKVKKIIPKKVVEKKPVAKVPPKIDPYSKESYDGIYATSRKYAKHYKGLRFFPVWDFISGWVKSPIVDLGCGCGHLGHLLSDREFPQYTGYDFSAVAIKKANALKLPGKFRFIEADLRTLKLGPATYIATEVFEHIKDDKALISRLPKGVNLIFSVPNYKAPNHYRTYNGVEFIKEYYKDLLNIEFIKEFPQNDKDSIFVVKSTVK